jgi:hypothetical protein
MRRRGSGKKKGKRIWGMNKEESCEEKGKEVRRERSKRECGGSKKGRKEM